MYIKPNRLKVGDHIRVIAPSQSMSIISENCQKSAYGQLEKLGLKVSFGNYCLSNKAFNSGTNEEKIKDLLDACADPSIKGILTVIGGFNSNQLLDEIDYDLIAKNPKLFCGYSDITALQNAILTKSNLITYSGPHFSTFGCKHGIDWLIEHFLRATFHTSIG